MKREKITAEALRERFDFEAVTQDKDGCVIGWSGCIPQLLDDNVIWLKPFRYQGVMAKYIDLMFQIDWGNRTDWKDRIVTRPKQKRPMTPEDYLNEYTELTPELARELRLEDGKMMKLKSCCSTEGEQMEDDGTVIYEAEFGLLQRVKIREINREGIVKALIIDSLGIQYQVHYWDNSSRESVWLFEEELSIGSK